jgi:excisionase family DNA binding protein
MIVAMAQALVTIEEAGRTLGVSRSTIWRRIQRGELRTIRKGGRRLVEATTLRKRGTRGTAKIPAFSQDHPIFRLVGAGRGGGHAPGARDKHAVLDE